jgi:hypothetical protein
MQIVTVMDQIGDRLRTISGLRVFDFPPDSIQPPAAVVSWPTISYDSVMARGADDATFPVHVLVGRVVDRSAQQQLALYLDGTGSKSIKTVIEAGTVGDSVRVSSGSVSVMTVGGVEYLTATFQVDVIS